MTFQPLRFPAPVRAALGAWRAAERAGIGRVSLDADSLVAAARKKADRDEFVDESFREPMARMLASIENEARLHPLGRVTVRESLVRALVNRLRLEEAVERHPEIGEIDVAAPVFVVGLQRTGTTLLHRLLNCEPRLRELASWEGLNPAPFPGGSDRRGRDPRLGPARTAERALRYLGPGLFAIHPVEAEEPEEDIHLLDVTFVSPAIDAILPVPSYQKWFCEVDQLPAYHYMRRLMQFLLWQRPGRWLGKTPHHMEYLPELLTVFPDAKIVLTHRDPGRTVASFCSMMGHSRAMFSDRVVPDEIGAQFGAKAIRAVERLMAARDAAPEGAYLDVLYQDVMQDPLGEVRRVYDFIGLELAPETESVMQRWLAAHTQTKHGVHRYALDDFGLERAQLDRHFEPYRARFGVPTE